MPNARAGRWALAFINNGKPEICTAGNDCGTVGGPTVLQVGATILACPAGSVATGDYDCQPVQMPDTSDITTTIDVPNSTNDLILYTEVSRTASDGRLVHHQRRQLARRLSNGRRRPTTGR